MQLEGGKKEGGAEHQPVRNRKRTLGGQSPTFHDHLQNCWERLVCRLRKAQSAHRLPLEIFMVATPLSFTAYSFLHLSTSQEKSCSRLTQAIAKAELLLTGPCDSLGQTTVLEEVRAASVPPLWLWFCPSRAWLPRRE